MQSFMQIYREYPDSGSMLQLGYYAAYMQQYAATSAFFNEKPLLLFSNTKILLNLITLCKTEQPFCKYRICSIFSLYAANMQHYAASPAF